MNRSLLSSSTSTSTATQQERFIAQHESAKARAEALRREAIAAFFDAAVARITEWTRRLARTQASAPSRASSEPNLA